MSYTARISSLNALAIVREFHYIIDMKDFKRKVKLSQGHRAWMLPYESKDIALVKQYATKHCANYYLVGSKVGVQAIMQSHCKSDDFCFRELNFIG